MSDTYKIIYKAKGKTFEISPDSPAKLLEGGLAGFDCTELDVKISPYATIDGGYPVRRRFAERELAVTFEISREESASLRRKLISMLDPREDGELIVDFFGDSRRITVIPCGEPKFDRHTLHSPTVVTLNFVAPTVFFSSGAKKTSTFRKTAPLFTFPLTTTAVAGVTGGLKMTTDHTVADNTGDTECGIIVKVIATGGSVVNPTVSCGDDYIKTNLALADGDVLVIDTRKGQKCITVNGERCFSFMRDSAFFSLPLGQSTIKVDADSGKEYINAQVEYVPLYYGV